MRHTRYSILAQNNVLLQPSYPHRAASTTSQISSHTSTIACILISQASTMQPTRCLSVDGLQYPTLLCFLPTSDRREQQLLLEALSHSSSPSPRKQLTFPPTQLQASTPLCFKPSPRITLLLLPHHYNTSLPNASPQATESSIADPFMQPRY